MKTMGKDFCKVLVVSRAAAREEEKQQIPRFKINVYISLKLTEKEPAVKCEDPA